MFDYKEYKKLADKNSRLKLKRDLYLRKKVGDEVRITALEGEIEGYDGSKQEMAGKITNL